ncbi:hypothetical protein LTR56_025264 [Elasticomyces elasticus]|nr:hypothetical protein LTR56_025264 [Elasticomyces elasticus]KAK4903802.1 hypothetical protein LTR49_026628 [Elasticomyces elasticus]KAK5733219.1 hypothetical protein LTS12_026981 [Elasticomyces elasticus]
MGEVVVSMQRPQEMPYRGLGDGKGEPTIKELLLEGRLEKDEDALFTRSQQVEQLADTGGTSEEFKQFFKWPHGARGGPTVWPWGSTYSPGYDIKLDQIPTLLLSTSQQRQRPLYKDLALHATSFRQSSASVIYDHDYTDAVEAQQS